MGKFTSKCESFQQGGVGFLCTIIVYRKIVLTPSEVAPAHKLRTNLKYRELEEDDSWSEEQLPS